MKMISHRLEDILDSAINRHSTGNPKLQKDFLGHLLQLTKLDDPATSLTLPQVKPILMGTDTTAAMVEWAMAEMLQHPRVVRKVQEELTEVVGLNNTVEEVHLPKLKYLNAVVKETLRMHPSSPLLIPHCPSKDTCVGGYMVPKGARIFLNVYAIQRHPKLWEDPLLFQPERFLSTSSASVDYLGSHFHFLPFGSGRRICPGIPLAERMSVLVLASLMHAFEWKLPTDTTEVDFSEKSGLVVKKSEPLIAVPVIRLSSLELYSYND